MPDGLSSVTYRRVQIFPLLDRKHVFFGWDEVDHVVAVLATVPDALLRDRLDHMVGLMRGLMLRRGKDPTTRDFLWWYEAQEVQRLVDLATFGEPVELLSAPLFIRSDRGWIYEEIDAEAFDCDGEA